MTDLEKVIAWCRAERQKMIDQRDGLISGKIRIHEMQDATWVDVTFQSTMRVEKAISDCDRLLAQLSRRENETKIRKLES
jgi:hypothetical protein